MPIRTRPVWLPFHLLEFNLAFRFLCFRTTKKLEEFRWIWWTWKTPIKSVRLKVLDPSNVLAQPRLCRYDHRFSELNAQIQGKLRQTRKYYATYNALLEIKEVMLKEASLLNSISSQVWIKRTWLHLLPLASCAYSV